VGLQSASGRRCLSPACPSVRCPLSSKTG
jgi:hypothetical protein